MSEVLIRQSYHEHAALAQLYRWYQLYEEPKIGIANQLDILSADVTVRSGLGEVTGHEAYKSRIAQIPTTWSNAHFVHQTRFSESVDNNLHLHADITYLNQGMLPNEAVRSAELEYETKLKFSDDLLPKFTELAINPKAEPTTTAIFKPAFAANRAKSLMHYWLAIVENPKRDAEPAQEILALGFKLDFSSGPISDFAGFIAWLKGPAAQVSASRHTPSNFKLKATGPIQYEIQVDFDWQGLLPDGNQMTAKSHHTWQIIDNPTKRFAQVKNMKVEMLVPPSR
jgi:hypothetical protein